MTLKEMQEKREKLVADARAALSEITANTDDSRTSELEQRHDAIMSDFDAIEKAIEREERQAKLEAAAEERRAKNRPIGPDTEARGQDASDDDKIEYRSVFAKVICGLDVGELTAEERAVLRQGVAKFEQRVQSVGTASAGGYTVPTTLMNEIVKVMKDWGPMFDSDVARVITTPTGNPMKVPTVDDTASTAGAHTEGTALTDDGGKDVTIGQKSLDAFAFDTEFIRWSWELDTDSIFDMELLLASLLGERLARLGNAQLTTGSGSSAPNGIVTASTLGKTAASATAIAADELIDLQHSVNAAYRRSPKCRWQFADSTLQAIRKLKDGQGNYLWQMGNVQTGAPDLLLGKPYSINDDVAAIATGAKAVIFGDHSKYFVRKVGAPIFGVLRERFWPDLGIAGLMRFDGELADTAAVKHLKLA
jgi:HK97 family phage major capsid protein